MKVRKPQLWEYLVCLGIAIGLVGIFTPAFRGCACATARSICLNQLKTTGHELLLYAADWDDHLPDKGRWVDSIVPRLSSPQRVKDVQLPPSAYGYAFDSRLSQKSVPGVKHPEGQPLIYDSKNLAKNASDPFTSFPKPGRHRGKSNVAYLDGHAKSVEP